MTRQYNNALLAYVFSIACSDRDPTTPSDTRDSRESVSDSHADTDAGTDTHDTTSALCDACLPEEGLPTLSTVDILELPTASDDICQGVCIKNTGDSPGGSCFFPHEPDVSCDYGAKGIRPSALDPALEPDTAKETYCLLNAGEGADPDPARMEVCVPPADGTDSPWCSTCRCDETFCVGTGNPFDNKTHRVYIPKTGPTRDELFVFLGGTGGNCSIHKWINTSAATAGYRSLCLAYVNDPSSNEYCTQATLNDADATCTYDFQRENIFGEDHSTRLQIGEHNAITTRLRYALQALARSYPDGGFDAYLEGETIRWDRIVLSGFSQGGGHSGLLSMEYPLARAIFFSKMGGAVYFTETSPEPPSCSQDEDCIAQGYEFCEASQCFEGRPASYVHNPRLTSGSRSFLLFHERESSRHYSPENAAIWGLDVCGEAVSVDGRTPADLGCSHILSTNADPADGGDDFHGSMGGDGNMARGADGYPRNQQAFLYMLLAKIE